MELEIDMRGPCIREKESEREKKQSRVGWLGRKAPAAWDGQLTSKIESQWVPYLWVAVVVAPEQRGGLGAPAHDNAGTPWRRTGSTC